MAPTNDYLLDEHVQQRLADHNNRLIKMTTTQFPGEEPEVHWDFNRKAEYQSLGGFLDRFAEPDFVDGKVSLSAAAQTVYGEPDEYLLGRVQGMLKPASGFNKEYPVNGLVYVLGADGNIVRDDREKLADRELLTRLDVAQERIKRTAHNQYRGVNAAERRANRIHPEGRAAREIKRRDAVREIGQQAVAQLELGTGEQQ